MLLVYRVDIFKNMKVKEKHYYLKTFDILIFYSAWNSLLVINTFAKC